MSTDNNESISEEMNRRYRVNAAFMADELLPPHDAVNTAKEDAYAAAKEREYAKYYARDYTRGTRSVKGAFGKCKNRP